jgi:hypothetical protein
METMIKRDWELDCNYDMLEKFRILSFYQLEFTKKRESLYALV